MVKLIIYDFDGVLTDNRVLVSQNGEESVSCNRGDGWWIKEIRKTLSIEQMILTTELNPVVLARAKKLNLEVIQAPENKLAALKKVTEEKQINFSEIVYIGNEMNDYACMREITQSFAPQDAHPEILKIAKKVFPVNGGAGIVRYLYDWLQGTQIKYDKPCYVCGGHDIILEHNKTRDRNDVKVLRCQSCGLVFLNRHDHINETFYEESGMFQYEMPKLDQLAKDEAEDTNRRSLLLRDLVKGKTYLDFGCGSGFVLKRLAGEAKTVAGLEPNAPLRKNMQDFFKIKAYANLNEIKDKFEIISLFHVLEHLPDPKTILKELKSFLAPNGTIVIEVPSANDALLTFYQSSAFKDFTFWSCHLYLFNPKTLTRIIEDSGLTVKKIEQTQRYPLANHLHWLSQQKPGGHNIWNKLRNSELDALYSKVLGELGICDTIVAYIE